MSLPLGRTLPRLAGLVIALMMLGAAFASSASAVFTAPVDLQTGSVRSPQVAVDPDGDNVFTWELISGGDRRVQGRTISSSGVLGPLLEIGLPAGNQDSDP